MIVMRVSIVWIALLWCGEIQALEIRPASPLEGDRFRPGEISFSWNRPTNDKTSLLLEIKLKSGRTIYTRSTIGTRRTKYLTEGDYEWRIGQDMPWMPFSVDSGPNGITQSQSYPVDRPVTKAEIKIDQTSDKINSLSHELLDEMKKNEVLAKQFEQRLKIIQQSKENSASIVTKMQALLEEMNHQRQQLELKLQAEKAQIASISGDQEIIFKAGPKPVLAGNSAQMREVLHFLRQKSKYPRSLKLIDWSSPSAMEWETNLYWAARIRILADNSLGEAQYLDVIAFWRFDELSVVRYGREFF